MHIGLIIYDSLDTVSGGYLYDRQLVAHLAAAGHTVEVYTLPWRSYPLHLTDNFARDLADRLLRAPHDVLLQDELNHPSLVWLNPRLRGRVDYPLVSIVHHLRCSEPRGRLSNAFYRLIERQYLAGVDGFVFNSETTRESVAGLLDGLGKRPGVVATPAGDRFAGIQARLAALHSPPAGRLSLLFVGSVIPRKGLHTLLQALARFPFENWRLDVVGRLDVEPAYVQAMQEYAERATWGNRVRFWGALDDEGLALRYAGSDLLVMPSTYEGFGIVYLEAMSFGLPAVGTTAGGAREIIQDGENGLLVPPDDPAALARCLTMLHEDRNLLDQMSASARTRYEQFPTWSESAARIETFLEEIANS